MKVLIISEYFPFPPDSGSKARIWHFVQGISRSHTVFFLTFDYGITSAAIDQLRKYCEVYLCKPPKTPNLLAQIVNVLSSTPMGVWRRKSKGFASVVHELVEKHAIDCVLVIEIWMAQYVRGLSIYKIIDKHNIEFVRAERRLNILTDLISWKRFLYKFYYSIIARRLKRYELGVLKLFNRIIVCSDQDSNVLRNHLPNLCVTVVENGVDLDYFHPATQEASSGVIVFTGTMSYEPNIDAALYFASEILPVIKGKVPHVLFYIVGNAPSNEVKQLSKDPNIVVTGYVADVRPYVWNAEVVVAPLRMGSGTRLKILEAMAMQKPVVSTSIGCEGLNVRHDRDVLIFDKSDDFAEAVIRIQKDPELARRLAHSGRALISEQYSWDNVQKTLVALINSIGDLD